MRMSLIPTEMELTEYIPAPETPFDVRSHFCPMSFLQPIHGKKAYALWQKTKSEGLLKLIRRT